MFYIYIAKNEEDFMATASSRKGGGGVTMGVIDDPVHHRKIAALMRLDACKDIINAFKAGNPLAEPLRKMLDELQSKLGAWVRTRGTTFLIHFGGQGYEECISFTKGMNLDARQESDLQWFRFIALSQYNRCPKEFFQGEKFSLPADDVVNGVLAQWEAGKSGIPVYDHLRAIVLLCQTLGEMERPEREEKLKGPIGPDWWRKYLSEEDAGIKFSEAEEEILGRSALLRDFRRSLLDSQQFDLLRYSDRLPEIAAEIGKFLSEG